MTISILLKLQEERKLIDSGDERVETRNIIGPYIYSYLVIYKVFKKSRERILEKMFVTKFSEKS